MNRGALTLYRMRPQAVSVLATVASPLASMSMVHVPVPFAASFRALACLV